MTPLSAAQVKSLLIIASQLSGYPIPQDIPAPAIEAMSSHEMAKAACDAQNILEEIDCGVIGFFEPDTGELAVDVEKGAAPDAEQSTNTIAIHELTHWLQFHNHFWPRECPARFTIEYEAYKTGLAYRSTYENKPIPAGFIVPPTFCPVKP